MKSENIFKERQMSLQTIIIAFFVGGIVTATITSLEMSGHRLLSGLATLVPVFTLISYVIIGISKDGLAVSQHAKFVLIGTIITWIPYMIAIIYLAPKIGAIRAVGTGLSIFCVLAGGFVFGVEKLNLFR